MAASDREFVDSQLALLKQTYSLTDVPAQDSEDSGSRNEHIPTHLLLAAIKRRTFSEWLYCMRCGVSSTQALQRDLFDFLRFPEIQTLRGLIHLTCHRVVNSDLRNDIQLNMTRDAQRDLISRIDAIRNQVQPNKRAGADPFFRHFPVHWPGQAVDDAEEAMRIRYSQLRKRTLEASRTLATAQSRLAQLKQVHATLNPLITLLEATPQPQVALAEQLAFSSTLSS
jgi:hypothetical protein